MFLIYWNAGSESVPDQILLQNLKDVLLRGLKELLIKKFS
jgi:hypothetical protein